MSREKSDDIRVHVIEEIAVLSEDDRGWKRKLTLTQWNGNPAKLDIRSWNEDNSRCSRGLTFTDEEMRNLVEAMDERGI